MLKKLEKLSSIEVAKDKAASYDDSLLQGLRIGSRGQDVSILQQFLINAEVYPEALVTGYFGRLTRSALQRFQREQNISPANGYFGLITKKRLLNLIRLKIFPFNKLMSVSWGLEFPRLQAKASAVFLWAYYFNKLSTIDK